MNGYKRNGANQDESIYEAVTSNPRPPAINALRKRWRLIFVGAVLIAVALVAVFAAQSAFGGMMSVSGLSQVQFDGVAVHGSARVVVEITSMPAPRCSSATSCKTASDSTSRRTSETLNITFTPNTNVVMGQASDVKPGAIIQISGLRSDAHTLIAQRVVILTGYVSV